MKIPVVAWAACLFTMVCHGQGTVFFNNLISGSIDARVYVVENGVVIPADGRFVGQLYAAAPGGVLAPVGDPVPFRNGPEAGKGYLQTQGHDLVREIPGVPIYGLAEFKMVAWLASAGTTYESAIASLAGLGGQSSVIQLNTGGGLLPPSPLSGLQGFTIGAIPEPSATFLSFLGGCLLFFPRPPSKPRCPGHRDRIVRSPAARPRP